MAFTPVRRGRDVPGQHQTQGRLQIGRQLPELHLQLHIAKAHGAFGPSLSVAGRARETGTRSYSVSPGLLPGLRCPHRASEGQGRLRSRSEARRWRCRDRYAPCLHERPIAALPAARLLPTGRRSKRTRCHRQHRLLHLSAQPFDRTPAPADAHAMATVRNIRVEMRGISILQVLLGWPFSGVSQPRGFTGAAPNVVCVFARLGPAMRNLR